jgi:cobalt/nickel transport system permease protein
VIGAVVSWFASSHPDGLEWSIAGVTGSEEVEPPEGGVHESLGRLQEKLSFLPDYGFQSSGEEGEGEGEPAWPAVDPGTSVSGVVGGVLTLVVAGAAGWVLRRRARTA